MLFRSKVPEGIDHVGIFLGTGKVLHATRRAGRVVVESLAGSQQFKRLMGYRRLLPDDKRRFVVTAPPERLDLMASRSFLSAGIPEDLIEEIGRLYGFEDISPSKPRKSVKRASPDKEFFYAARIREALAHGDRKSVV